MDCMNSPRTPKRISQAAKCKLEQELAMAESFYPITPLKPRPKGKKIDCEKLRAQMRAPPPAPERLPPLSQAVATLRRRRNSIDTLFIKRRPLENASPLKVQTERVRRTVAPYCSPSKPRKPKRVCSDPTDLTEPAPWIVYTRVPQNTTYPPTMEIHERPLYPPDDDVVLGSWERLGCCIYSPDAVSKETLNIRWPQIDICFQWKGYEQYGVFWTSINIPDFQNDPFGSRLAIIREVRRLFDEFKKNVKYRRSVGDDRDRPGVDVLAFVVGDVRVTRLERRVDNLYQVVFTYPTRAR